jgi:hypothetical protein
VSGKIITVISLNLRVLELGGIVVVFDLNLNLAALHCGFLNLNIRQ